MAEKIRIAMLGCGGMSGAHMRGFQILWENDVKMFDIVATCDIVEERAAERAKQAEEFQGTKPNVYTDVMEMLDKEPEKSKDYMADLFVEAWDAGYDEVLYNAPCLVIAQAEDEALTAQQDCDIALTYFELAAKAMGLGTCWNGILAMAVQDWKPLKEAMELSNNYFYPMVLGYPKLKYHRLPERKKPNIIWK
jgi:hypothetical protein